MTKRKEWGLWGGFVDGRLHVDVVNDFFGGFHQSMRPALFQTRREAREQYQDVRKIIVIEAKPRASLKALPARGEGK